MLKCLKCLKEIHKKGWYGLHPICFMEWFQLKECIDFQNLNRQSGKSGGSTESVGAHHVKSKNQLGMPRHWNSSFFHGNYKKYAATLAGKSYILKVREEKSPELPDVEFICNQIASTLGIPVPPYYLLQFSGHHVFATKNFLNDYQTLNHIYRYLKNGDEFDIETLLDIILSKTNSLADTYTFVQVCLFDSLVGNHDRHGRNLGFITTPNQMRLSPIYDNPSQLGLESEDFLKMHWSPKGKVFTKSSKEPLPKDYVDEFIRLGFEDAVEEFIKRINKDKIVRIIENGFCSSLMKEALKKLIHERINEMVAR